MLDHKLEPKAVRRIEVITGPGGRRRFADEEKARIIEEALAPGAVVSAVARRSGLTPQQLFTWLRQNRSRRRSQGSARDTGLIEVEAGGVTVGIAHGADVRAVAAVMAALTSAR